MRNFVVAFLAMVSLAGCSQQHRTAEPLINEEELGELLGQFHTNAGSTGDTGLSGLSLELLADPVSTWLYHTANTDGLPASSVFSIMDMNALDNSWPADTRSSDMNLASVDVVFMDTVDDNSGRVFSLMVKMQDINGTTELISMTSDPDDYVFTNDALEVYVRSVDRGSQLVLRTTDLHDDYKETLADAVKLKVYIEQDGERFYAGQISTMAGFGKR